MSVFRKIWCAFFSCNTRFEIYPCLIFNDIKTPYFIEHKQYIHIVTLLLDFINFDCTVLRYLIEV